MIHGAFLWIHDKKGKLLMKVKQSQNHGYKIELDELKVKHIWKKEKQLKEVVS